MASFRTSRIFDVCFIVVLIAGLGLAVANRAVIGDKIFFVSYQPDDQVNQVATNAGLTEVGRHDLYRTNPVFTDLAGVTAACDIERLGCLDGHQRAFILDDTSKPNQTVVTAAHEMLHLAYSRLTATKKAELAPELDAAIKQFNSDGLREELQSETTDEDRRDEAHSLLGTEYSPLSADLEAYYQIYFTNRLKIVKAAMSDR